MVAYGRLKTKGNCKLSSLKVVAVAYERCSLTRGTNYSDLTREILVFWKSGRSREVVAYERWSQGEVELYLVRNLNVSFVFIIFVVSWCEIKIKKKKINK